MEHIAILRQPFYDLIISGEKTIESRWSLNKIAPFDKVKKGDIIYLKKSGCQISAKAVVKEVKQFNLTPTIANQIFEKYGKQICSDKFKNKEEYLNKKYLTLIWLENVEKIPLMNSPKSHGAGWIVLEK